MKEYKEYKEKNKFKLDRIPQIKKTDKFIDVYFFHNDRQLLKAKYKGEFIDENNQYLPHGEGHLVYNNKDNYNVLKESFEYIYCTFNYGVPFGKGIVEFSGGDKYIGNIMNYRKNGSGIYIYKDGDKYIGNFENNDFNGNGKYIYNNNNYYEGSFSNGKYNGFGIKTIIEKDKIIKKVGFWYKGTLIEEIPTIIEEKIILPEIII